MKTISLSLIFVLLVSAQQATQAPAQAPQPAQAPGQQPAAAVPTTGLVKFAASTQLVIETVSVQVLQDFTDKKDDIETAITKLFITDDGLLGSDNDEASADTGAAFGENDAEFNLFTTDRQLGALQTAVKMLGTLNEKKVLVYF